MVDAGNGPRWEQATHKTMRQKLERVESSLNAVPPAMEEAVEGLESHCTAGVKLASLLETVLQDSPLVLLARRYKEACETLLDKTSRASLTMRGELVAPVKRLGPTVSRLRSRIDSHGKVASRLESCRKQLEGATLSSSTSRNKLEQVEAKFRSSAQEFAHEDEQLVLANIEFCHMRTELMGGCFLGFLEVVSRVMESASDLLAPLGAYKELRHDLRDSPASSTLKEATVSWLAATQVNQNLRSFGGLSRNDVQCMLYQHPDGLPDTIRSGLNGKVDRLLKLYSTELARVDTPHHVVTGGFHFNPKAIELALKDCCSELEAKGAGADHAYTAEAKEEQISCDVPRTMYIIGDQRFGAATGEHVVANIAEKKASVRQLLDSLEDRDQVADQTRDQILEDFAQHVLNESCTTVTNTTAKTAVQLVFGKANLVLVRPSPSPEDNKAIHITARRNDGTLTITVPSSWWLVEDYAAFAVLERPVDPTASLGVVDACYTISLSLDNFCSDSPFPELPSVAITYRQPSSPSLSPSLATSPPQSLVGSREKEKLLGSFTTLRNKFRNISQKTRARVDGGPRVIRGSATLKTYIDLERSSGEKEEESGVRRAASDSEAEPVPALFGAGHYSSLGRGDSLGRGVRATYPHHGIRRSDSDKSLSSQSTLVPPSSLLASEDHPLDIMGLINAQSRPTLTKSRVLAHDKFRQQGQGYQSYRSSGRKERKAEEDREGGGKDDDQRTIEGSPSHDISIASQEEMERVFSLLSTQKPMEFEDYQIDTKPGYPRKGGYDDRHGDRYQGGEGSGYGYKYGGHGSHEYVSEGEKEGQRERGYVEEGKKDRDNSSSGSSGIEDPYNRRSRSGSAASLHHEAEAGRERAELRTKGASTGFGSTDSGIGGAVHQGQGGGEGRRGEEGRRQHVSHPQDLPFDFISKGLGSLIHSEPRRNYGYHPPMFDMEQQDHPPVSSSSSGGSSPVIFRAHSAENIRLPERSASRSSTHSMPPSTLHGSSTSLNDFDHTPGSRPRPYDYTHLSQGSLDDPAYWDYHAQKPSPEHFGHPPYNYNVPPPGGPHGGPPGGAHAGPPGGPHGGPYNYDGRYGEHPPERHSRSMQRGVRVHSEDYSPSPAPPPLDHRHQPPHYWPGPGFDRPPPQGGPPQMQLQMPPPHSTGPPGPPGPPGSRLHPPGIHDNRFRFHPIAPSSPSPSMSPGPSPHPTPPPTPPPPHGHMRPPQVHGPPAMPAPYHSPGPRPNMHPPPRDFRPPPAPPQMGPPPPHGYQRPMHPREPNFGPPPRFGPSPSPGAPPPVSGPGRFPPGPSWDHGWGGPH